MYTSKMFFCCILLEVEGGGGGPCLVLFSLIKSKMVSLKTLFFIFIEGKVFMAFKKGSWCSEGEGPVNLYYSFEH